MTARRAAITALALSSVAGVSALSLQRPTFRGGIAIVTVDASVKRNNVPVAGLEADDFVLTDNGVLQAVETVSIQAVPVDVTVFHDTSPSQGGRLDELKDDVRRIFAMLRSGDRFRLLAFGANRQVVDAFGWRPAGAELDLSAVAVAATSSVNDGILAALLHRPDVGRRHLVVALTDAEDAGSAVTSAQVLEVARRADGVVHLVAMGRSQGTRGLPAYWLPVGVGTASEDNLRDAAGLTGGQVHDRFFGSPDPVDTFEKIFEDFRASYVLQYSPAGVEPGGWHEIEVSVPSAPRATVRARRGYYGSSK